MSFKVTPFSLAFTKGDHVVEIVYVVLISERSIKLLEKEPEQNKTAIYQIRKLLLEGYSIKFEDRNARKILRLLDSKINIYPDEDYEIDPTDINEQCNSLVQLSIRIRAIEYALAHHFLRKKRNYQGIVNEVFENISGDDYWQADKELLEQLVETYKKRVEDKNFDVLWEEFVDSRRDIVELMSIFIYWEVELFAFLRRIVKINIVFSARDPLHNDKKKILLSLEYLKDFVNFIERYRTR